MISTSEVCRPLSPTPLTFPNPLSHRNRSAIRNRDLASIITSESTSFDPSLNRISMDKLLTATKNFGAGGIISDGSFGLVYKATLSNGITVAVKKLSPDAFQGFREFRAEMDTLGQLPFGSSKPTQISQHLKLQLNEMTKKKNRRERELQISQHLKLQLNEMTKKKKKRREGK